MDPKDKEIAEAVLTRLCKGARIDGVRFGPVPQLLLAEDSSDRPLLRGQVFLNLASRWDVFDALPSPLPDNEADLPERTPKEQIQAICELGQVVITDVQLGDTQPHLSLTLKDGRTLFVNGRHEMYECWELGVAMGNPQEPWLVVAIPGGEIGWCAPDNFDT